jgi:hypothetical protein
VTDSANQAYPAHPRVASPPNDPEQSTTVRWFLLRQIDLICARQPISAEGPPAAPIGG